MAKYYFIGIGGISMSALAIFLKCQGNEVCGSDLTENETLLELKNYSIPFYIGHKKENIENFCPDFVVINSAISQNNEELIYAKKNKIKILSRAKVLGDISKKFKNVIAISGTHGKTTTVGMISEIFIDANLKPTVHIGGILAKTNSNYIIGENKFFITEACEYKNNFLTLRPKLGIMLNLEKDHMDFFKNYKDLENSFDKFLSHSKIKIYPKNLKSEFHYIFQSNSNFIEFYADNIIQIKDGIKFKYFEDKKFIDEFTLKTLGKHNVNNAIVAIMTARHFKIKLTNIKRALRNYSGVKRRFEKIGYAFSTPIIHDYAHHPTEIKKVISQAKTYGKVLTIFQPHTFSRTKKLFKDFLNCFDNSDALFLYKTYPAREEENQGYSARKLFESLKKNAKFELINYFENEEELLKETKKVCSSYNIILVLGAGNIDLIAKNLAK